VSDDGDGYRRMRDAVSAAGPRSPPGIIAIATVPIEPIAIACGAWPLIDRYSTAIDPVPCA